MDAFKRTGYLIHIGSDQRERPGTSRRRRVKLRSPEQNQRHERAANDSQEAVDFVLVKAGC